MRTFVVKVCRSRTEDSGGCVAHKPCGFLSNSQAAHDFVTADAVLATGNRPHCWKPLIQTERRILEDSPNLFRELTLGMLDGTLPNLTLRDVARVLSATTRTCNDAIRPTMRNQVIQAVISIGEVNDGFLAGGWFGCHESSKFLPSHGG